MYSCTTADDLGIQGPPFRAWLKNSTAWLKLAKVTFHAAIEAIDQQRKKQTAGVKPALSSWVCLSGYAGVYETLAEKSGANIYIDAFISGVARAEAGKFQLPEWLKLRSMTALIWPPRHQLPRCCCVRS